MLDRKAALNRVIEILSDKAPPGDPWVVVENQKLETKSAWIFIYNSERYLETGDVSYALAGNGPIFVNKKTGKLTFYGAIPPLNVLVENYEKSIDS